ncbi:hypothetical protein niasHS_003611 [Heterodera schachtii]|uniref:Uncharacterized protein n=1 Tax=Heterodera schachtii TaxID=97005 RepID=A0ABD2KGZ9_HETSC
MTVFGRQLLRKFGGGRMIVRRVISAIPFKPHVATIAVIAGIFAWMHGFKVLKRTVKEAFSKDTFVYHQEMEDFIQKISIEQQTKSKNC